MTSSDSLFQLIRSLSKEEKRYFILSTSRYSNSSESSSLKLFRELDRQKKFDETLLKERCRKEAFIKRLAVEKHNLYNKLLRSLAGHSASKPVETRLKEMIVEANLLLQKNLFRDFEKHVEKAKKLAYKYEKWMSLLELITLQRKLTRDGIVSVPLTERMKEEEAALQQLTTEYGFRKLSSQVNDIVKKSLVRGREQLAQLREIARHPLFTRPGEGLSFNSLRYKYNTLLILQRTLGNEEANLRYSILAEELFGKYPHFQASSPNIYLSTLTNRIIAEGEAGMVSESFSSLEKLRALSIRFRKEMSEAEFNNHLLAYYALTLELLRQFNSFEKGKALLPEMRSWLVSCRHLLDKQNLGVIYLAAANISFTLGDHRGAVRWVQEVIDDADIKKYRDDVQCYARIIQVIALYKLGQTKQLPRRIRSTFRFLLKKKKLYRVELCLVSFIRNKMAGKQSNRSMNEKFRELKKEVDHILTDKNERKALTLFDISSWLESEVRQVPMLEVLKLRT